MSVRTQNRYKKYLSYLLGVSIFLTPNFSLADFVPGQCSADGYTIATINGILTNKTDAEGNKNALQRTFGVSINNQNINYQYFLNPSHLAGLGDVTMSVYQKYFDEGTVKDYDLVEMIKSASEKVTTQKLLLVPHSQGNFYANSFYDVVAGQTGGIPKGSIGVYGVATPAGRVAGGGGWLTSDTDKVIAGIVARTPFKKIMTPNIHIELQVGDDPLGHNFSDVYLKYLRGKIVTDIKSALNKLSSNDIQDKQKLCIQPPKLTLTHKIKGSVLALADPVARTGVSVAVGAVTNVYQGGVTVYQGGIAAVKIGAQVVSAVAAAGNFAAEKTLDITAWVYNAGTAVIKAAASSLGKDESKSLLAQAVDAVSSSFLSDKNQGLKLAATVDLSNKNSVNEEINPHRGSAKNRKSAVGKKENTQFINIQDFNSDTQNEDAIIVPMKSVKLAEQIIIDEKPVRECKFTTDQSPLHQKLIINEVAWMGGIGSANDEWIELRNISGSTLDISGWQLLDKKEQIKVVFGKNTKIANDAYWLLERTDDDSMPGIKADAIYAGALANTNEGLRLYNNDCILLDEVFANSTWSAGDGDARKTMERLPDLSWHTYNGSGITLENMLIMGTPKNENSQLAIASAGSSPASSVSNIAPVPVVTPDSIPLPPATTTMSIPTAPSRILISEIQITGGVGKSNNDFVELYNPNVTRVNLNGYRLVKRTKTGTSDTSIKSWTADAYIPAKGYYLWANSDYTSITVAPDMVTSAALSNDNGIALRYGSEDTGAIIDAVGWGTAGNVFIESRVFGGNPIANQSISRRTENDTNDNAADFIKSHLSPKNTATSGGFIAPIEWSSQSAALSKSILISEVYPDRTGANKDFVELYNPNAIEDISRWSLQVLSANATSTKKIIKKNFTSGNKIPASGFFLVGIDNYSGADMTWASGALNSTDGATIFLVSGTTTIASFDDPRIVDRIAYGSGSGLLAPETLAAPMPAVGKSLERKSLQDELCISAVNRGEFSGNGCDTDNNFNDFELRATPNPQGLANLIEPRIAPILARNFTATYSTTTLNVFLNWTESRDYTGATSSIKYALKYATSTSAELQDLTMLTATSSYNFKTNEVGITNAFSIIAKDKDGLSSDRAETAVIIPSIFDKVYLYPDSRNPGTFALEFRYGTYPFMRTPNYLTDSWRVLIAYKNQEAPAIPYFSAEHQYAGEPESSPTKRYGEWGTTIGEALKLKYKTCSDGYTEGRTALILPDSVDRCSSNYGGVRNSSLNWGNLEDLNLIISLSGNQTAPVDGDYITLGLYGYSESNTQTLLAVDRQKYNFQNTVPAHSAPTMPSNPELSFNKSTSRLRIIWDASTDPDTIDSALQYEINLGTTTPYESGWMSSPSATLDPDEVSIVNGRRFTKMLVEPRKTYAISLRAKDDFGNFSEIATTSWSYPSTTFSIQQTQMTGWNWKFGEKNPNCPPDVCSDSASLQTIRPTENIQFNIVTVRVRQTIVNDTADLRLSVYADANNKPDFNVLLARAELKYIYNPDPNADVTFTFDNPVSLSADTTHWLVLNVGNYSDSRGWFRNSWQNALNTGSDLYAGGQAGMGTGGICSGWCTDFQVPYPDDTADWYFKIGLAP